MKKKTVSVCMVTYGHENYIRQAIEGVLMQECDFDVELIIANDASPDATDEIIKSIIENHSRSSWIRYIKHEKNIGMMPNFIFAFKQCQGKYVALCDGDDYWIDRMKLQKQVDFLETNPDYVLCFHQVNILKTNGEIVDDFITKIPENYETIETLARWGNYMHTPSVVFRNIIKEFPFEFSYSPIGDFFLYMLLAEKGKLKYIEEKMAVYRFGVGFHSTNSAIKMTKSNFKLFTLLLSYSKESRINVILLDRQLGSLDHLEVLVRAEYQEAFVSHHIFFKAIKSLKNPRKFLLKLKRKLI
ncbi:glycosyltransferase family 2 protein [Flavobacterium undicola]|uniref:glycosyltransferase family 2 protein n=1 Tax=Flavobacterium undicola TaxID=1932779 RepID=UPI001378BFEE|nr:glycosyltransferase [Flavobacterium undicola]MBA0884753.1 glycosyltransferase [Flavobacterium undicola]